MTRPTDEELEAMAARLSIDEPWRSPILHEAAALLRACKGQVKVKSLEWRDSYGVLRAETPFGDYKIGGHVLHRLGCPAPQSAHGTIADAKAAAQADYEGRILAAIEQDTGHE